jgi:flagellar basal-body rod modification protein FlgD
MTTIPISAAITSASSAKTTAAKTGSNDPAAQRDMFMSLLVAQLKNQDPLSPQDGTAFVAQLAQFNSLDQLVGIRQSIDKLNTLLQKPPTPTP